MIARAFRTVWGWWVSWGRDVITCVAVGMAVWALVINDREATERRNQTCTIFETKQRADVRQLVGTYHYIAGLSPKAMQSDLNRAVIASLPQVIADAKLDDAPDYCDEPGIGLPEPDPVLPKPPPNLPHLR